MTQTVTMPDGSIHNFPDEATPEMMSKALGLSGQSGQDAGAGTAFGEALANAVPFGQRITSGIGALGAATAGAGNVGDLYNQAQENTRATLQANPKADMAGSVIGAIPTLISGAGAARVASTPVFAGNGSLATMGNIAAQSIKGAATAAPVGAAFGAGNAQDIQSMPQAAKEGAEKAAAIGGALPLGLAALGGTLNAITGIAAKGTDSLEKVGTKLYQDASASYTKMRNIGATFNQGASSQLSSDVDQALQKVRFIPALNPQTTAIVSDMKDALANGKDISLDELDQWRRLLGRVGGSEDGLSAGNVRQAIDSFVKNANQSHLSNGTTDAIDALNAGRQGFQKASKFDDVLDVLKKAGGDPNKIKAGMARFMNNEDNTTGWSADELNALKKAANNTMGEKLLKAGGKFGFDLGSTTGGGSGNTALPIFGAMSGGAFGMTHGGPALGGELSALIPAVGTAARAGQTYIARGKAQNLLNAILK